MKQLIHRIFFATDFSPSSAHTFRIALEWADTCDAALDIVHVTGVLPTVDLDSEVANIYIREQEKHSRLKLSELENQAKARLTVVQTHLLEGMPAEEITNFAKSSKADLIVTGTHGWTGLDRVMMGSVAERVICNAPCPVLSVRDQDSVVGETAHAAAPTPSYSMPKHILFPLDFSDCSLDAFEYGINVAKWCDASITLLHAMEPFSYSLDFTLAHPAEDREYQNKFKSRLQELTNVCTSEGLTANYMMKSKPASESILDGLKETDADLIVMGTHGRQGLRRLMMGNVAAAVLRQSSTMVLTVKSPKFKMSAVSQEQENVEDSKS